MVDWDVQGLKRERQETAAAAKADKKQKAEGTPTAVSA